MSTSKFTATQRKNIRNAERILRSTNSLGASVNVCVDGEEVEGVTLSFSKIKLEAGSREVQKISLNRDKKSVPLENVEDAPGILSGCLDAITTLLDNAETKIQEMAKLRESEKNIEAADKKLADKLAKVNANLGTEAAPTRVVNS